jgi:N-acetylmuramoyl-L-alanine amidase CwlA
MITKQHLTSPANRPYLRSKNAKHIIKPQGIVLHWTANLDKGATAKANRNYFNRKAKGNYPFYEYTDKKFNYGSSHYIVDDKNIIEAIPPTEMAYHCGDTSYLKLGRHLPELRTYGTNRQYIGIEICVNKDSDYMKTLKNVKELIDLLNTQFNFKKDYSQLYRHYDISGKDCPKQFQPYKDDRNFDWNWLMFKEWLSSGLCLDVNTLAENRLIKVRELENEISFLNTRLNTPAGKSKKTYPIIKEHEPRSFWQLIKDLFGIKYLKQ